MFVINKYTGIPKNKELIKNKLKKIVNPIRVDLEDYNYEDNTLVVKIS